MMIMIIMIGHGGFLSAVAAMTISNSDGTDVGDVAAYESNRDGQT